MASIGGDAIKGLTDTEIGDMLSSVALEEGEEHVDQGVGGETKAGDDEGNCSP